MIDTFHSNLVGGSQLTMEVRLGSPVLIRGRAWAFENRVNGSDKDGTCSALSPGQCISLYCVGLLLNGPLLKKS